METITIPMRKIIEALLKAELPFEEKWALAQILFDKNADDEQIMRALFKIFGASGVELED